MSMVLQCYLIGRDGEWEALCTDFDIAARGRSFQEASDSLSRAIHEYLEYVETLPKDEQEKFLGRRAPLHTRLGFALGAALTALSSPRRDDGARGRQIYPVACAA